MTVIERAQEIAAFLGIPEEQAIIRLNKGFGYQHQAVAEDWRKVNPQTDAEILEWYRNTESYIWELSAYHADPGFNYSGMCQGIAARLKASDVNSVLCLGDGIGDLTLSMHLAGFNAIYHDLAGSRTHQFAEFRFNRHTGRSMEFCSTYNWEPDLTWEDFPEDERIDAYDAIVSLDFLEHVTDVPLWTAAIFEALKPGGIFVAQNAFACGSGPDGSMPMHLARNDRFERDWDPLLFSLGFKQLGPQWYQKPAEVPVMA